MNNYKNHVAQLEAKPMHLCTMQDIVDVLLHRIITTPNGLDTINDSKKLILIADLQYSVNKKF